MHEETLVSGSSDIKQPQRKGQGAAAGREGGSSKVTVASRPESPTTKSSQQATHTHTHTHLFQCACLQSVPILILKNDFCSFPVFHWQTHTISLTATFSSNATTNELQSRDCIVIDVSCYKQCGQKVRDSIK